jgi:hypothetical protein
MSETGIGHEWFSAALAGGLSGDAATTLASMSDQFVTPYAMQQTAGKLVGVPAGQIAGAVQSLAQTDDLVRMCVRKPAPTPEQRRAELCYPDGTPRLPPPVMQGEPTLEQWRAFWVARHQAAYTAGQGLKGVAK